MKWYADKIKIVDLKGLIYRLVDQTLIFLSRKEVMEMGVEIEGLEFQVETKVGKGVEGIDKLSKSLSRLKGALKGINGINSSTKQLEN